MKKRKKWMKENERKLLKDEKRNEERIKKNFNSKHRKY